MFFTDQSKTEEMNSESNTSILEEELGVLKAIYIHELDLQEDENGHPFEVSLTLHPATGDDITIQFVCMTVVFKLPKTYPDEPPDIIIKNPRGLAEEEVQRLQEDMHVQAKERCGAAMLYELIEMAKEILTEGNIPRCPCVVCLEHFHEGDIFTRTECYHYFHKACLARYVEHALTHQPELTVMHQDSPKEDSKLVCPVCRTEISYDLENLNQEPWLTEEKITYIPSKAMLRQQRKMAELFAKQKSKGGIIDLEAEKTKYLVNEETVVILNIEVPEKKQSDEKAAPEHKNSRKGSGRIHSRNDNIVAKYKGFPRRNRQNDYNSSRKTYAEERSTGRKDKGDNSKSSEMTFENRGRRDEDDRSAGRSGKTHGSKDETFRNDSHRGRRNGPRSGGSYYQDRRENKRTDVFDHSDMGREIDRIEKSSSCNKRYDFKRKDTSHAGERVTSPRYGDSNDKIRHKRDSWHEGADSDVVKGENSNETGSDHLKGKSIHTDAESNDKNKDFRSERYDRSHSYGNQKYSRNRQETHMGKPFRRDTHPERKIQDRQEEEAWDDELDQVDRGGSKKYSNESERYRGNSTTPNRGGRCKHGKETRQDGDGGERKYSETKKENRDAHLVSEDDHPIDRERHKGEHSAKGRSNYRDRQTDSEKERDETKGHQISSRGQEEEDWDKERIKVDRGRDGTKMLDGNSTEDWDREKIDVGSQGRLDSGKQGNKEYVKGHDDRPRNNRRVYHRHGSRDEDRDFGDNRRYNGRDRGKGYYGNSRDWHSGNRRSTDYRADTREIPRKAEQKQVEDWDREVTGEHGPARSGHKKSQTHKDHVKDSHNDGPSRRRSNSRQENGDIDKSWKESSSSKCDGQLKSSEKHVTEKPRKHQTDAEMDTHSAGRSGVRGPPGIQITGPPPGFESESRTVKGKHNHDASIKAPPGFR